MSLFHQNFIMNQSSYKKLSIALIEEETRLIDLIASKNDGCRIRRMCHVFFIAGHIRQASKCPLFFLSGDCIRKSHKSTSTVLLSNDTIRPADYYYVWERFAGDCRAIIFRIRTINSYAFSVCVFRIDEWMFFFFW